MTFIAVQNPQSRRYLHTPLKPPSPSASQWATNTEGDTQPDTLPQLYPWKARCTGALRGAGWAWPMFLDGRDTHLARKNCRAGATMAQLAAKTQYQFGQKAYKNWTQKPRSSLLVSWAHRAVPGPGPGSRMSQPEP